MFTLIKVKNEPKEKSIQFKKAEKLKFKSKSELILGYVGPGALLTIQKVLIKFNGHSEIVQPGWTSIIDEQEGQRKVVFVTSDTF